MNFTKIDLKVIRALGLCIVAGSVFAYLKLPLPWMIGPLLAMAAGKSFGIGLEAPPGAREGGQTVIAVALGLYFTPQVSLEVSRYLPWMLLAGVVAIFTGLCGSLISRALMGRNAAGHHNLDAATAFFSSIPGGATEMAVLTGRFGGRVDRVAFALVLWQLAGIHPSTGMLAVAPGGIAEMCITAKLMQLGVPVVTAFHVARVVLLVSFSGWVYMRFLAHEGGH